MPHALLLSPDDQAVSAITGVLEEMSVTCERPLDGASAAQKLNSHSFDLVLVDCENLPAAKLIFDVCRRGKNGNNPVPIAIVDGRAGLPTAFRLGAELILTKPVAKDQARTTIRTAVSRVRKDVLPKESVPAPPASAATPGVAVTTAVVTTAVVTQERAQAAAAASVSSQPANLAHSAPSLVSEPAPGAIAGATISSPVPTTKMHSAAAEIDDSPATPKSSPKSASAPASSCSESSSSSESSSARTDSADSKPARSAKPSDDPVLAELERAELELSQPHRESSEPEKAALDQSATESFAPVFSSYQQGPKKTRGPLVALLMPSLTGAGFYAAWTYQPGFRAVAQPQIDRALALAARALPPASAPNPVKPSTRLAPARTAAPASPTPTAPNKPPSTVPNPAASSATGAATTSAAATSANAELPWENSAIILSSKGAEKRLAHSVPAPYPVEARLGGTEGTVVLRVVVDETGKVDGLRLVEGDATLATAAIQSVKQWRYRPYVRDGKAQPFQTVVIVDFQRP